MDDLELTLIARKRLLGKRIDMTVGEQSAHTEGWYVTAYKDGYRARENETRGDPPEPPVDTETPEEPSGKLHDADGNEVEIGRLYWIETRTTLEGPLWQRVKAMKAMGAAVEVEQRSGENLWPFPERLRRHHPGEWTGPPSETEEPDKPLEPLPGCEECSAARDANELAAELGKTIGELDNAIMELAEANRQLEAQATAPKGVLRWKSASATVITAHSNNLETSTYSLIGNWNSTRWGAWFCGALIYGGSLIDCMAACEEREANPDKPPPSTTG